MQGQTDAQLEFLLAHDTDPFNRWGVGACVCIRGVWVSVGCGIRAGEQLEFLLAHDTEPFNRWGRVG